MPVIHQTGQLPTHVVGRAGLQKQVEQFLSAQGSVLLYGTPGIGKHALAGFLASRYLGRGGRVLWLNGRFLEGQVLRAYGQTDADQIRDILRQTRPLVVISRPQQPDNAAHFIWAHRTNNPVIVISETASDGPWEPVLVRRLDAQASEQLFTSLAGVAPHISLLEAMDGHPLVIRLLALTSRYQHIGDLPPRAATPIDQWHNLMNVAFLMLHPAQQGLLLAIGTAFADRIHRQLVAALLNQPEALEKFYQPLVDRGFLEAQGDYFALHPLIRAFAHRQLGDRLGETQNHMLHALSVYREQQDAANPYSRDHVERGEHDMLHLIHAAEFAAETQQQALLNKLVWPLIQQEAAWSAFASEVAYLKTLAEPMGIVAPAPPVLLPEERFAQPDEPTITNHQITTQRAIVPHNEIQVNLDAAIARQDRPEMARLSIEMGEWHTERQEHEAAMRHFQQGLALYQEIGDLPNVLEALDKISSYATDTEQILDYVNRGLNIANHLNDDGARGHFLNKRGDVYTAAGDSAGAMEAYKGAVKVFRALRDPQATGITLGKLANLYLDLKRYREATVSLSEAITLFEQAGRTDLQGRTLGNLGTALGYMGRWHEAGRRHAAALRIARELGDVDEERFQLQNLAYVAEVEGHTNWAITYGRQALHLALQARDDVAVGQLTFDLGRLMLDDNPPQAAMLLEKSAAYYPRNEARQLYQQARAKLETLRRAGHDIDPPEEDLRAYAKAGYPL